MRPVVGPLSVALAVGGCGSGAPDAPEPPGMVEPQEGGAVAAGSPDGGAVGEATATPATCPLTDVSPGAHTYACGALTLDVTIPTQCATAGVCGLIVDVPGWTMTAKMEDENTNMRALGSQYGYVVVQPTLPAAADGSITQVWAADPDDDDLVRFLTGAVPALGVDARRVHLTGFSDGGVVTFRLLCAHADQFASVAPAAAGGSAAQEGGEQGCTFTAGDAPSRPIPVLYMQGTKDPLVPFTTIGIPQRDAMVAFWGMGGGSVVAQGSGFVRTRYVGPAGSTLEFLQHDYASHVSILGGHCFPGSTDPGTQPHQLFPFGCDPPDGFAWGEEVIRFFMAHEG